MTQLGDLIRCHMCAEMYCAGSSCQNCVRKNAETAERRADQRAARSAQQAVCVVQAPAPPVRSVAELVAEIDTQYSAKAAEGKELAAHLMSIRKSVETTTGFGGISPSDAQSAYNELTKMSDHPAARLVAQKYDSKRDDPKLSRLLFLLHDLLERQGGLDKAGVNVYALIFLQEGLYEFTERYAKNC